VHTPRYTASVLTIPFRWPHQSVQCEAFISNVRKWGEHWGASFLNSSDSTVSLSLFESKEYCCKRGRSEIEPRLTSEHPLAL